MRNKTPEPSHESHSQKCLAAPAQHLGDFLIEKHRNQHRQSEENRRSAVIDRLASGSGYRNRASGDEAERHADQTRHEQQEKNAAPMNQIDDQAADRRSDEKPKLMRHSHQSLGLS